MLQPTSTTPKRGNLKRPLAAYSRKENLTFMAVDNLPCELPRNTSRDFGRHIIDYVFPQFFNGDADGMLAKATIARGGELTERYAYLWEYATAAAV